MRLSSGQLRTIVRRRWIGGKNTINASDKLSRRRVEFSVSFKVLGRQWRRPLATDLLWSRLRGFPSRTGLHMMLRFRLSQKYKPESLLWEKLHSIGVIILKMVNYIWAAVDQAHADKRLLAYWLTNSSELIYFFNHDVHLSQQSIDAQEALAECVQVAFRYFVSLMKKHIGRYCLSLFSTFRFCRSYRIWLVYKR